MAQQKNCQLAKAKAHIEQLKQIDKKRPKYPITQGEKDKKIQGNSILSAAKKAKEDGLDATKEMDQLLKYAKVVSIRDLQKKEHIKMEKDFRDKEKKLDLMMELERLKELKYQQEVENDKKRKRLQSARVIKDQIKENEIKRLQEREMKVREGELMKRQIKAMQDEELRNEEKKRLENIRLAKEIENINKVSELNRDKKRLMEKEEDLKRLKYNMDKAKKEEEEIAEKKRIQIQKEKETQKLREKQEKFADKQALLDELRAKRAYEEAERKAREKELEEIQKLAVSMKERNSVEKIRSLEKYLKEATLKKDILEYHKYVNRKTGYANIDEHGRLFPGLYVLGAVTGLGKTTFMNQMSTQMSNMGQNVLYISYEQTMFELVSKGLARFTYQSQSKFSAIDIRRGAEGNSIDEAIAKYMERGKNEFVYEAEFDDTIDVICEEIEKFVKRGMNPIVVIEVV